MIDVSTTVTGVEASRRRLETWRRQLPKAIEMNMARQALRLKTIMVRGIRDQHPGGGKAFQPLAESTKKMKGSSKALINHGDLLNSIGVDQVEGGEAWFIGVNRQVESPKGKKMVDLAETHDKGTEPFFIQVTPKMRRFFMAMFIKGIFNSPLPKDIDHIAHPGVPARPFLEPAYNEWAKDVERQLSDGIVKMLGAQGGGS